MMNGAKRMRAVIATGKMATGLGITLTEPAISEMAGYAGFDFIFIDTEHTPMQNQDILRHLVAARSSGCVGLVRVCSIAPETLKPILDMGPDGIIFPFVHTAALARQAVSACSYPDSGVGGVRGQGPGRAVCYGFGDETAYLKNPEQYVLRIMLIESWEGYENLDEILAVEGVDGIYIGMGDMMRSVSSYKINVMPQAIFTSICQRTKAAGKLLGAPLLSLETCALALTQGVQWGAVAIDTSLLAQGMRSSLAQWKG